MNKRTSFRLTTSAAFGAGSIIAHFLPYPEGFSPMPWRVNVMTAVLMSLGAFAILSLVGYPRKGA